MSKWILDQILNKKPWEAYLIPKHFNNLGKYESKKENELLYKQISASIKGYIKYDMKILKTKQLTYETLDKWKYIEYIDETNPLFNKDLKNYDKDLNIIIKELMYIDITFPSIINVNKWKKLFQDFFYHLSFVHSVYNKEIKRI